MDLKVVNFFILLLCFNTYYVSCESEASLVTLEYVAVITRHGSRTPLKTYPNDPYPYNNKIFWPTGPDELTYYGKKQLYLTGLKLRERYDKYLPDIYYPNDTVADYNNINRDFMSASCILAALYPPLGEEVWNPNLMWQPIPVHVRQFDVCGLAYDEICPSYQKESNELLDKLNQDNGKNSDVNQLLKEVSLYTGANISHVTQLFDIYDVLTMQSENGFKLPAWTKFLYPEPMRSKATPVLLTQYGGSQKLINLGAGPELKRISDLFNMKVNGTFENNRKMYIEAAHDCTLIALLKALGNNDPNLEIRTSAYITFELHYLPELYIVQVLFYKNSEVDDPVYVNIAGCPSPCSLENFTKFVDSINPPNWNDACKENNVEPPKNKNGTTTKSFWQNWRHL